MLKLEIKAPGKPKVEIEIESSSTIADLKKQIAAKIGIPAEQQKLFFKGQNLYDEKTLLDYKLNNGDGIGLVKIQQPKKDQMINQLQANQQAYNSLGQTGESGNAKTFDNLFGDSFMQEQTSDPNFFSQILSMNPKMKSIMKEHPELSSALASKDTMKQFNAIMNNPQLQDDLVRQSDNAFRQLENIPGGFQILERLTSEITDPMFDGFTDQGNAPPSIDDFDDDEDQSNELNQERNNQSNEIKQKDQKDGLIIESEEERIQKEKEKEKQEQKIQKNTRQKIRNRRKLEARIGIPIDNPWKPLNAYPTHQQGGEDEEEKMALGLIKPKIQNIKQISKPSSFYAKQGNIQPKPKYNISQLSTSQPQRNYGILANQQYNPNNLEQSIFNKTDQQTYPTNLPDTAKRIQEQIQQLNPNSIIGSTEKATNVQESQNLQQQIHISPVQTQDQSVSQSQIQPDQSQNDNRDGSEQKKKEDDEKKKMEKDKDDTQGK
ncbi:MAG: hypothetical protein EZS28_033660 [Streblomastix strix]|uniref:Ubiquitin-like domain-containing protein n=1 Tax=Streblomastix strix TaxID=222440 RepID=A0A5J4UKS8_9EUKA|nr:MAG: hypothetical protein EZS28_033660 [Streblomastix strix]